MINMPYTDPSMSGGQSCLTTPAHKQATGQIHRVMTLLYAFCVHGLVGGSLWTFFVGILYDFFGCLPFLGIHLFG